MSVIVVGGGPAALAAALLLARQNRAVQLVAERSSISLPLVLNGSTLNLLGSLFGRFELRGTWLKRSLVAWDDQELVKSGLRLSIPSHQLADILERRLEELCPQVERLQARPEHHGWTVLASRPPGRRLVLGQRQALVAWLAQRAPEGTMWVKGLPEAWLMAAPDGNRTACVVAVPSRPADPRQAFLAALESSGWFPDASLDSEVGCYECSPAILDPAYGSDGDWVAVGECAARLDPMCGDGVGFALRSAILATATLAAEGPWEFYESRLREAFAGHLRGCAQFYSQPAWRSELQLAAGFRRDRPHPRQFGLYLEEDRLLPIGKRSKSPSSTT